MYVGTDLTRYPFKIIHNELGIKKCRFYDLRGSYATKILTNGIEIRDVADILGHRNVETANKNLLKSGRKNISFKVMDNLKMDTPDNYFDLVTARHTIIDPVQIYKTLKKGGQLVIRGVDKLDCWSLKRMFKRGQAYHDVKPISLIDYEAIMDAGFKEVELIPPHVIEYYKTKEDLYTLLVKTPILDDFSEESFNEYERKPIEKETFEKYVKQNTTEKGIKLIRRYYGIIGKK